MGLLHICWQNSYHVRKEITQQLASAETESWWIAFELVGTKYEVEKEYATLVGWASEEDSEAEKGEEEQASHVTAAGPRKSCSFVVAHADEFDDLIWYSGGLVKDGKAATAPAFKHPASTQRVLDGDTYGESHARDMGCSLGSHTHQLTYREAELVESFLDDAKTIDVILGV